MTPQGAIGAADGMTMLLLVVLTLALAAAFVVLGLAVEDAEPVRVRASFQRVRADQGKTFRAHAVPLEHLMGPR